MNLKSYRSQMELMSIYSCIDYIGVNLDKIQNFWITNKHHLSKVPTFEIAEYELGNFIKK